MRLTELLDIDVNSKKIISVVGGGGKTSLIFRLAEVLAELERIIHRYVDRNTDRKFKSLEILEIMK